MRFNWKVLVAIVLIIGVAVWAADGLRARTYAGQALTFLVGHGATTVTNPSDAPVPAQLIGTGTRTYNVSSTSGLAGGPSVRTGTGSATTGLFDMMLPPGVSNFTVVGGTNVNFVGDAETRLSASVQPASDTETRTTLIASAIVILGALFYIYRATGQNWLNMIRGNRGAAVVVTPPVDDNASHLQGQSYRSYGDNRT